MKKLLVPLLAALLSACNAEDLYSKLTERQANEMVAVLQADGIHSEKVAKEGGFSVATARADLPAAMRSLNARGLPREQAANLCSVFKRDGIVSTPMEERGRMLCALSQEISSTISNIDGVIVARVLLAMPERNPLNDKPLPSGASVFIKHRPDRDLSGQVAQIKTLVVNSIEGLSYENVTVALFPADDVPLAPAKPPLPAGQAKPRATQAAIGLPLDTTFASGAAASLLLAGGGSMLWLRRRGAAQRNER